MRVLPRIALIAGLLAPAGAAAQEPVLGTFEKWNAIERGEGEQRTCFAVATPDEASLVDRRGNIWFMIYNAPGWQQFGVVQINLGYPLDPESEADLSIDGQGWKLYVDDSSAWARPEDGQAILEAMRRGLEMTVEGLSARGNRTTDRYSLRGVTAAIRAIDKACGR